VLCVSAAAAMTGLAADADLDQMRLCQRTASRPHRTLQQLGQRTLCRKFNGIPTQVREFLLQRTSQLAFVGNYQSLPPLWRQ